MLDCGSRLVFLVKTHTKVFWGAKIWCSTFRGIFFPSQHHTTFIVACDLKNTIWQKIGNDNGDATFFGERIRLL